MHHTAELFPEGIVVVTGSEAPADRLYDEEAAAVARAIDKRRLEFAAGRACAREALRRLGAPVGPIPVSPDRAPIWPDAVVGAITHCDGFVAAAVGWRRDFDGIGLDAEGAEPLAPGLVRLICTPAEQEVHSRARPPAPTDWPKLAFSAKEAVHKVIGPLTGVTLGFRDVEIDFDLARHGFTVRPAATDLPPVPDLRRLVGRFQVTDRLVVTSCHLPPASAA